MGSHGRYCEGCRCPGCREAHRRYLSAWRAGRLPGRVDAAPVRAHLAELVASGLLLAYVADEAGVPRSTARRVWAGGAPRVSGVTAAALLAVPPLDVTAHLPRRVRLAETWRPSPARERAAVAVVGRLAELTAASVGTTAAAAGVSPRTVFRWRARARAQEERVWGEAG